MKVGIITVSDKGSAGKREDLSGPAIKKTIQANEYEYAIIPDEISAISEKIIEFAEQKNCNVIFTNGGTGLSSRDVTPEATRKVIDREIPGIAEVIRMESYKIKKTAMLSRAIAGSRGKTLIINLPGSPKAVKECLGLVLPVIEHALDVLEKGSVECGAATSSSPDNRL